MRRTFLKIAAVTAFAWAAIGAAHADEMKVGANIGNVPWEFQDANGNMVGFEIDLVNEVAKRLGIIQPGEVVERSLKLVKND